ncbi:hypothetical protein MRX96_052018 [Rhipicephalus microplus]
MGKQDAAEFWCAVVVAYPGKRRQFHPTFPYFFELYALCRERKDGGNWDRELGRRFSEELVSPSFDERLGVPFGAERGLPTRHTSTPRPALCALQERKRL